MGILAVHNVMYFIPLFKKTWMSNIFCFVRNKCHKSVYFFLSFFLSVAVLNGFLYVAGGEASNDTCEPMRSVCRYDPRNCSWLTVASMQNCRQSFQLGVLNGALYAVGKCITSGWYWCKENYYIPVRDVPFNRMMHDATF